LGHHQMRSVLEVVSQAGFDKFLKQAGQPQ
jgi:heme/copper-type cytochrome/quinol oxidase subunit 2